MTKILQTQFLSERKKCLHHDENVTERCLYGFSRQYGFAGLGNGLALNRRQAITDPIMNQRNV